MYTQTATEGRPRLRLSWAAIAATCLFTLTVAPASEASLVDIGDPLPSGSWIQTFQASLATSTLDTFDSFEIELITDGGGGPFESPWVTDFSSASWALHGTPDATNIGADGDAVETLAFDLHFDGDMDSPVSFFFSAYTGDILQERIQARWNGGSWLFNTDHLRNDDPPVPEPATLILSGIGFTAMAARRLKRRRGQNGQDPKID